MVKITYPQKFPTMYMVYTLTHTYMHTHTHTHTDKKCEVLSLAEVMRCLLTSTNSITKLCPYEVSAKSPGFILFAPDKVLNTIFKLPFLQSWDFWFQYWADEIISLYYMYI